VKRYRIVGHFKDRQNGTPRAFYLTTRQGLPGNDNYPAMQWIEGCEVTDKTPYADFDGKRVWQWAKWAINKTHAVRVEVVKV